MSVPTVPRRVLMTTDTVGGVFEYATELSRRLSGAGVEVLLATMGAPLTDAQGRALETIAGLELFQSNFRLEWMDEPWRDVDEAGRWLLDIESSTRPDIVHLNGYAHGGLPWRAPSIVVGHSCVLSWWRAVLGEAPPASLREYQRRVRRGLHRAGLVVAPSKAMLAQLHAHYGSIEKSRVIYNARDARDFLPRTKEPFVFAMGRLWDEAKNMRAVDEAAAVLPWSVHLAGRLEQPGAKGGSAAVYRPKHARALGPLDAEGVKDALGRASIYVHPARYEPFGLSVLEAALAGCALVLGDIPSLREIWGDAAIFVPTEDTAELSRELTRLIGDKERRRALAARAMRRASRYHPDRMLSGYLAAYRHAMGAPRIPRDEERSLCI
jgi:glycosyltransferase involved in cell wall biosynthesis